MFFNELLYISNKEHQIYIVLPGSRGLIKRKTMRTFYKLIVAFFVFPAISLFPCFITIAHADRFNVDSIKALVRQISSDTGQVKAYIDMASIIYCEDSTKKIEIANEAKKLAEYIKWHEGIYKANRKLAEIYFVCMKN